MKHPLVKDTINNKDIDELISWLSKYPRLTKGPITLEFEKKWSEWLGVKNSIYVNSGSSANLLMVYSLMIQNKLKPGDKVVVPAISWATDLSPVIQFGLEPVLCDCNLEDLSIDLTHFKSIIQKEKPKALILVSVLGLVPEMKEIVEICKNNNIILLEDTCESLGSKYKNKKLGTFGDMSTFSLYFGHHISTIEGGMVCTNNDELSDIIRSIRNHGWDRDWDEKKQSFYRKKYNVSKFDALYKFYYPGFNVRATDLQAKIGLRQLKKLDDVCEIRERNFQTYLSLLKEKNVWLPKNKLDNFTSNFCFPIICKNRIELSEHLIKSGVECRPLIAGSMGTQPMYTERYGIKLLKNAEIINTQGMYIPNNQDMNKKDVEDICNIVCEQIR